MKTTLIIIAVTLGGCSATKQDDAVPSASVSRVITLASPAPDAGRQVESADALRIYDPSGRLMASGRLVLPDPLPGPGTNFEGEWELKKFEKPFPSESVTSGKYKGEVSAYGISLDLNPGWMDNNVLLSGKLNDAGRAGDCLLARFEGGSGIGTFTIGQPPRHAR